MNDYAELDSFAEPSYSESDWSDDSGYYLSAAERKFAATVSKSLALPFLRILHPGPFRSIACEEGDPFQYQPDFLIRCEKTDRVVAVALQERYGLSRPNLITYQLVSDAYRLSGEQFLLIVDGTDGGLDARWLQRDHVRALWLDGTKEWRASIIRDAVLAALGAG